MSWYFKQVIFTSYIQKLRENTDTHIYKITQLPVCSLKFAIQNSVC
jgi:hypothetical protein